MNVIINMYTPHSFLLTNVGHCLFKVFPNHTISERMNCAYFGTDNQGSLSDSDTVCNIALNEVVGPMA